MMESISRADFRVAKAGFEQRLYRGHRGKPIRSRERNLQSSVAAHRDSRDERRGAVLSRVVVVAKPRQKLLRDQGLPTRATVRMVEVVTHRAGAGRRDNHRRHYSGRPPPIKQRLQRGEVLAVATTTVQQEAQRKCTAVVFVVGGRHEDGVWHAFGREVGGKIRQLDS